MTGFDVLVIGSGAAGLTFALKAADRAKVAVLSKAGVSSGATRWAQGGIAAVLREGDTVESHIEDTLDAGAGLCNREAVKFIVERGPVAIEQLITRGVPFSRGAPPEEGYGYHLTREGGHTHRRVIHVEDATGEAVQQTLEHLAVKHPNITILENHIAVDLIRRRHLSAPGPNAPGCFGAYVLDQSRDAVIPVSARATVLATGGSSKVYLYATNPEVASGDGMAMAWRAGCRVANMEFNQFHPTALYHPEVTSFLVTEAMRGEGAVLRLPDGERFMDAYDARAELAPRDIVARAIDAEMKRGGHECVYLDITHRDADFVISMFPNIYRRALKIGIDITKDRIPVVPAAHYSCGGVMTDLSGRTDINQLYAVGEVAHTGLHGANRMASNSLLECLVLADSAADDLIARLPDLPAASKPSPWDESRVTDSDEEVVVTHNWHELRRFMWDYVGIVRTTKRLERAHRRIDMLAQEIDEYYGNFRITPDLVELRNLVTVADLIVRSAMARKESRGLHFTSDHPGLLDTATDTVLSPSPTPQESN